MVRCQGDIEGALKAYESVEQSVRAYSAMRIIPTRDRQNLFLNEARLLYTLKKYDEAADRLAKEDEISGVTTDGRFFLLRGNIGYRRAMRKLLAAPGQEKVKFLEEAGEPPVDELPPESAG